MRLHIRSAFTATIKPPKDYGYLPLVAILSLTPKLTPNLSYGDTVSAFLLHTTCKISNCAFTAMSNFPLPRGEVEARWQSLKDTIRRLYISENKTLEELRVVMADDYDFHAT
jgi:hypothetical protein